MVETLPMSVETVEQAAAAAASAPSPKATLSPELTGDERRTQFKNTGGCGPKEPTGEPSPLPAPSATSSGDSKEPPAAIGEAMYNELTGGALSFWICTYIKIFGITYLDA